MTIKSVWMVCSWLGACLLVAACDKKFNPADGLPPVSQVEQTGDMSLVTVDKPDQYPLIAADRVDAAAQLNVTGSVNPDIAREVPVISLASGRVVDIKARLGDDVRKGQLLLKVQSPDITNAFDTYLKAVNDEQLSNKAYARAKDLYEHGSISQSMLEQAEDTEKDMRADLTAAEEQLKTLGVDKNHPSSIVPVYAPISGVIIAQNVTNAAAAGVAFSGSPTVFTIADLSVVWILCDVYENDLPKIALGQSARIKINAFPGRELIGRISDIEPILDPSLRTAKVRIEVSNPGILKVGMFVTATLDSKSKEVHTVLPAAAVMHLHDRDWVFVPEGEGRFLRVEVHSGDTLSGDKLVILSGVSPGQKVVSNVLQLEATAEAK
jgi:membrane fusion protein, heavy metal efflux system